MRFCFFFSDTKVSFTRALSYTSQLKYASLPFLIFLVPLLIMLSIYLWILSSTTSAPKSSSSKPFASSPSTYKFFRLCVSIFFLICSSLASMKRLTPSCLQCYFFIFLIGAIIESSSLETSSPSGTYSLRTIDIPALKPRRFCLSTSPFYLASLILNSVCLLNDSCC